MKKITDNILIYPYPWFGERLLHKDVYQFPMAVARALDCKFHVLKGWLITGEEIDGQSRWILRVALLLNTIFLIFRLARLYFGRTAKHPCFTLFHLTWSSAIIASFVRLIWRDRACILIKSDLNPESGLATGDCGSFLEGLSIQILRSKINLVIGETSASTKGLLGLFGSSQVVRCPNGIDISSIQQNNLHNRDIDVIVVSRFNVEKKGVVLYSEVIPELVQAGLSVHLIGEGAEDFSIRTSLSGHSKVKVSEKLQHSDVMLSMKKARIFLSLSLSESFLIAIMEAYAMGCRVISTPVGVAPDLAKSTPNITIVSFEASDIINEVMFYINEEDPDPPSRLCAWDDVIEESGLIKEIIAQ
jgi:glycosyltransferase involved in cell wall biosynthesis